MHQRRHIRRRTPYDRTFRRRARRLRPLISVVLVLVIGYYLTGKVLQMFGVGNTVLKNAVILTVEDKGVINVSLEGGPLKRAEDQLKLYPGDRIVSSPKNTASLQFFDGTRIRLDESTQVQIVKSSHGLERSEIALVLEEGTVWVSTPPSIIFSGSILRTLETPYIATDLVSETELVLSNRSLAVFSADGLGLPVRIAGVPREEVIVGEGQSYTIPEGEVQESDLYAFRSPLDPRELNAPFVEDSRNRITGVVEEEEEVAPQPAPSEPEQEESPLVVTEPENESTVVGSTLTVSGRIGANAARVRINGYIAPVDVQTKSFSQEIALPEEEEIRITVEAVDADSLTVSEVIRTVYRDLEPPSSPEISSPATNGQIYRTNRSELEIRGSAPKDAVGIIVNGYRLQLFSPGDEEWSYLANVHYDNYVYGENVFEVVAIDSAGFKSEPAVVTIILGEGEEGIVKDPEDSEEEGVAQSDEAIEVEPKSNAPLLPGTMTVTAPQPGTEYTATDPKAEYLIEGTIPNDTHTVWVNDYRLRLFEPGKGFWNYIASVDLETLQRGENTYEIVARNKEGFVLDRFTYTVHFKPKRN